eukprot:scaffold201055_cov29-Tisochrysis_lutea.AAC.4
MESPTSRLQPPMGHSGTHPATHASPHPDSGALLARRRAMAKVAQHCASGPKFLAARTTIRKWQNPSETATGTLPALHFHPATVDRLSERRSPPGMRPR